MSKPESEEDLLLEHAIVNQLEADFECKDFDSMSLMLKHLIFLEPAKRELIEYLSDKFREEWLEGKTRVRY